MKTSMVLGGLPFARSEATTIGIGSGWDPSNKGSSVTLSNSDRTASATAALGTARGTQARNASGDWYFEVVASGPSTPVALIGLVQPGADLNSYPGNDANGWAFYTQDGSKYNNGASGYSSGSANNEVIGVRLHGGTITIYKSGSSAGSMFTGLSGDFYPAWGSGTSGVGTRSATIHTGNTIVYLPSGSTAWG